MTTATGPRSWVPWGSGWCGLLSNNPGKAAGLRRHGVLIESLQPLRTAPNWHNRGYLETKQARLGHLGSTEPGLDELTAAPVDVATLLGSLQPRTDRPYVVLKYAQTLDGRIATRTGDAKWISGEPERQVSHAMRFGVDAVLVGARTCCRTIRSSPCGWSRARRRCAWSWTRRCGPR